MRLRARACVLVLAALLAVPVGLADPALATAVSLPTTSPAYPISDPVYQTPPQSRESADVAEGDGQYLAVWTDSRTYWSGDHTEIYGARVSDDGTVLDPAGIRITSAPTQQGAPKVAWNGEVWVVVWTDNRNEDVGGAGTEIYGARVSPDGEVLDPDGVPIREAPLNQADPDVAWNGSAWVVAWTDEAANGSDIWVVRLTPQLEDLGPGAMFFAAASFEQSGVSLAVDGTTVVAVYTDYRDQDVGEGANVYMNRLSAQGEMLDDGFPVATGLGDQVAGGVAASSSGVLAVWGASIDGSDVGFEIRGQRVIGTSPAGDVIEIAERGIAPRVAWGDDGYLVVWNELDAESDANVVGRHVSLQAVPDEPFPITTGVASEGLPAAAAGDGQYLVVAVEKAAFGGAGLDILATRIRDGAALDDPPIRVASAARPQQTPALVRAGDVWVTAWPEYESDSGWVLRMGRIDDAGVLLDGVGTTVAEGSGDQRFPALAWNGEVVLVVWHEQVDEPGVVRARPMHPDGTAAGPAIELGTNVITQRPAVASNGGGFVVTWGRHLIASQNELLVQALDASGAVDGDAHVLGPLWGLVTSVAPLGTGYLVAWSTTVIKATRLDADGAPVDASPLLLSSSDTDRYEDAPSVASSGGQALVTWIQRPLDQVQGVRVDSSGTVLDASPILLSPGDFPLDQANAAWNGITYQVVWWRPDGLGSLLGTEVNRIGEVLVTLANVPTRTPGAGAPLLAGGADGRVAVGYSALDLGPPGGGVDRGYVRFVDVERPPVSGTAVEVAAGAAATKATAVTVAVPAQDATHVQLSNNGTTWTTRTYAATQAWTLTSTNGTKTVYARWRDAAGNWSAPRSDTIVLDLVAPTATAPRHAFVSGAALSSGRLPIRLTWSGEDATSGIARYEVARQTDGGAWSAASTVTAASLSPALSYGHTYRFRVRAIDRAGNRSAWQYGPTFRLSGYSEATGAARYSGIWSTVGSSAYWGGTARAASIAGRNVRFTFTGRSVGWVTLRSPARGRAAIYVNGVYQATVDLYAASTQVQRVGWAKTWTTSATRTLEIRVLGTAGRPRIDVDGFWVGS